MTLPLLGLIHAQEPLKVEVGYVGIVVLTEIDERDGKFQIVKNYGDDRLLVDVVNSYSRNMVELFGREQLEGILGQKWAWYSFEFPLDDESGFQGRGSRAPIKEGKFIYRPKKGLAAEIDLQAFFPPEDADPQQAEALLEEQLKKIADLERKIREQE